VPRLDPTELNPQLPACKRSKGEVDLRTINLAHVLIGHIARSPLREPARKRGLLERNRRAECTTARYEVAWSDRDSRPAVQQADPRRAVVKYATLHADDVAGAIRPDPEARIGEDRGIREGRDIVGSSLHANTTAIEGDQRVINEGMAAKRATR